MQDSVQLVHALKEFGHLKVYRAYNIGLWRNYNYPKLVYYVINTKTKQAFWAPSFINGLVLSRVIPITRFKTKEAVLKAMADEGITLELKEASLDDLDLAE